jgi:polysaccharide deacetylase
MELVAGKLVISLDMELMWGVRDKASKEQYGARVLGERQATPAMLELFDRNGIHATWAIVGMAMCDGVDELLERAPEERPTYGDPKRSTYHYLGEAGASERQDPYYFAPSIVRQIAACPGQEICTHTFSHYCCFEPGQMPEQFAADVGAARQQLNDWGIECKSIVFPRNQYGSEHLKICRSQGITVYRGGERSWFYRPTAYEEESRVRRLGRLIDSYFPLTGDNLSLPAPNEGMVNVPSSRLLRAYNPRLRGIEALRLKRITKAMTHAAKRGAVYHLWWHPHNFGADTTENVAFLSRVLEHFRRLRESCGMQTATMAEAAGAE